MSAVSVNISAYSATHVSSNILRGLKQIVVSSGLDASKVIGQWEVLEDGVAMWVDSSYLTRRVIEVRGGASRGKLIGRFDFTIDYGYGGNGDGELWLDPDTVAWGIKKNGSYAADCDYRIVAITSPGAPKWTGRRQSCAPPSGCAHTRQARRLAEA